MLRHCQKIKGYRLGAVDGEIGKVQDFYFDDQNWIVRYLVADTGYWLPDRLVLLSPHGFREIDDTKQIAHVQLTRKQIEDSPPITADQPVSRQYEQQYYRYYGWPVYWTGPALWGPGPYPLYYAPVQSSRPVEPEPLEPTGDPHLRSVQEIIGYQLQAQDGEVGEVDDVIVDDRDWVIRYLVITTGTWLAGRKVLLAPQWIQHISWERSKVLVDLVRERIESAPPYDPAVPLDRTYEVALFKHYSREGYWSEQRAA